MRTLRKLFAVAALSGALAVTLLAVSGMATFSAPTARADSLNWDAVAQCETGGNWSTNTGNGFYGGLQFTPATWSSNGGVGNPAQASRAEQIRVAENVLATQGIDAWPTCGSHGGVPFSTVATPGMPTMPQWRPGTYVRNTINEILALIPMPQR